MVDLRNAERWQGFGEERGGRREEGRERDGLGMGIGGYRDMTMKKKNIMCC